MFLHICNIYYCIFSEATELTVTVTFHKESQLAHVKATVICFTQTRKASPEHYKILPTVVYLNVPQIS